MKVEKDYKYGMLSKDPGNVFEGHTGDVACDHYHRYVQKM